MPDKLNVSKSTVLRGIKELKENGKLERIGKEKGGHWKIINNEQRTPNIYPVESRSEYSIRDEQRTTNNEQRTTNDH
jgi:DeoR/GlpR family transcriptional regulator of sugar metabolism